MASPATTTLKITRVRNEPGRTTTLGRAGAAGVEPGLELASRFCRITKTPLQSRRPRYHETTAPSSALNPQRVTLEGKEKCRVAEVMSASDDGRLEPGKPERHAYWPWNARESGSAHGSIGLLALTLRSGLLAERIAVVTPACLGSAQSTPIGVAQQPGGGCFRAKRGAARR
jgi:hypothetical protein